MALSMAQVLGMRQRGDVGGEFRAAQARGVERRKAADGYSVRPCAALRGWTLGQLKAMAEGQEQDESREAA